MNIKCSFCHRNKINYTEGNFFLLDFKKENNTKDDSAKIIKSNQKWLCNLHFSKFIKYKDLTFEQAKQKVIKDLNY